jgi:hypothetical protein
VPGDLDDGEATRGSTGWSGGVDDGKRLTEDRVGEEERMRACIYGLLEDDAPKCVGPTPGTV